MEKGLFKTVLDALMGLTKETDELQKNIQSIAEKVQIFPILPKKRSSNEEVIDAISNSNWKSLGEIGPSPSIFQSQVESKQRENAALDALLKQFLKSRTIDPIIEQEPEQPEIKEDRTDALVKTKRRIQFDDSEGKTDG
jgi:hypothetical protein